MRILNDVELTLLRGEMYASIAKNGIVTVELVKDYRDSILDISEYNKKPSMIVRNILNALSWNISNYSNDLEVVSDNYRALLQMVNDNIEEINIDFFYNTYKISCAKYNINLMNKINLVTRIEILELCDSMIIPMDYINESVDMKNLLLRSYLEKYEVYSSKIPAFSDKLKELIVIRNDVVNAQYQYELFN